MKEVILILKETSTYLDILDFKGKYDDKSITYYIESSISNLENVDRDILWK